MAGSWEGSLSFANFRPPEYRTKTVLPLVRTKGVYFLRFEQGTVAYTKPYRKDARFWPFRRRARNRGSAFDATTNLTLGTYFFCELDHIHSCLLVSLEPLFFFVCLAWFTSTFHHRRYSYSIFVLLFRKTCLVQQCTDAGLLAQREFRLQVP